MVDALKNENMQLQKEYDELQQKYVEQRDKFGYTEWSAQDIADWIVSIDKAKYYKYYQVLSDNLSKECIDRQCLYELDKNDLHRLGIVAFKDKNKIMMEIKKIIANGKDKQIDHKMEAVQEQKALEFEYNKLKTKYKEQAMEHAKQKKHIESKYNTLKTQYE